MKYLDALFGKKNPSTPGIQQVNTTGSFNKRNQERLTAYLYIIFSLFAVSFFGFFALRPAVTTISNLQKQLADSKAVYEALKIKLDALLKLDQQYELLRESLPVIYSAIPKTSQIPTLTRQIENLAQANKLIVNSIDFGTFEYYPAENNSRQLYSYTFTVDAQGNESDVDTFISNLISFNRILSIDKISTGRNATGEFQATITGQAYYYDGGAN